MSDLFPLDFEALKKGDVIPEERIEKIYNVSRRRDPERYRLSMLRLKGDIEQARGDLVCRSKKYAIHVLLDQEAEGHTWDRFNHGAREMLRNTERRARVDRGGFNGAQVAVAESRDRTMTMLALANKKEIAKTEREKRLIAGTVPEREKDKGGE